MSSYYGKQELVMGSQLKVQSLSLHFFIDGDAVAANVKHRPDEPAVLFLKTEGVDDVTSSTGALDSGEASPTFTAPSNAMGKFGCLIKVGEKIKRVVSAMAVRQDSPEVVSCTLANSTGLSANGDKIVLNVDSAADLAAGDYRGAIEIHYVVDEQA